MTILPTLSLLLSGPAQQTNQLTTSIGRLRIIISAHMLVVDKDIGYSTLSCQPVQFVLYFGTILDSVQLDNFNLEGWVLTIIITATFQLLKQSFRGATIWTIGLRVNDHLWSKTATIHERVQPPYESYWSLSPQWPANGVAILLPSDRTWFWLFSSRTNSEISKVASSFSLLLLFPRADLMFPILLTCSIDKFLRLLL